MPRDLSEFERRLKREMGFSLGIAVGAFLCAFLPLLAAALLVDEWAWTVIAWSAGGGLAFFAFLGGMLAARLALRRGDRALATRYLGAVLGLSSVLAGLVLVL